MNIRTLTKALSFVGMITGASLLRAGDDKGIPAVVQSGDDPNIGIKYKANQGLFVTEISAKIIGLKMADVEEKPLPKAQKLVAQVYDNAADGIALASAWIPALQIDTFKPGTVVTAPEKRTGQITEISVFTAKVNQKAEVLMEVSDAGNLLKIGQFLEVTATLPAGAEVVVIPKSAVLRTGEGTFVYVDNAGWKARTAVKTGNESNGLVEITDGLLSGDSVVTSPVMTLWMTELQLTKSGKACSCGH